jgi:two-component system phosphate regulon response regulator PhoB
MNESSGKMDEPKVLIVEDELAIRDMLRMALEMAAFRCLEADNISDGHARVAVASNCCGA